MKTSSLAQCYSIAGVFMPDGRAYCSKCAPESEDREPIYYADGTDRPIVCAGCGELLGVDLTTAGLAYVRSELLAGSVESITAGQWLEAYGRDINVEWATLNWLAYKRLQRARAIDPSAVSGADVWRVYQVWAACVAGYGHRYRDCEGSVSHKGMQSAMDLCAVDVYAEPMPNVDEVCASCPNAGIGPYCLDPAACPYHDDDGQELARLEAAERADDDDDATLDAYPSGTVDDSERYPADGAWAGEPDTLPDDEHLRPDGHTCADCAHEGKPGGAEPCNGCWSYDLWTEPEPEPTPEPAPNAIGDGSTSENVPVLMRTVKTWRTLPRDHKPDRVRLGYHASQYQAEVIYNGPANPYHARHESTYPRQALAAAWTEYHAAKNAGYHPYAIRHGWPH